MDYVITGLPLAPFQPLFGLAEAELTALGIVRQVADTPVGYPCRVTLHDAVPGESLLLLNWQHLDLDTPYRASGPIFVRESARETLRVRNHVPEQQRSRLLSVRGYDRAGSLRDADVVQGTQLEGLIDRLFGNPGIALLQVHYARHGCYACRIDRC